VLQAVRNQTRRGGDGFHAVTLASMVLFGILETIGTIRAKMKI
jgi:hypothetical protein